MLRRSACLLVLASLCIACDAGLLIQGIVVDQSGRPIRSAEILILGNVQGSSAANGCFSANKLVSSRHHDVPFRVQAPGYAPLEGTVSSPGIVAMRVVLAPASGGAPSQFAIGPSGCPAK